MSNAKHSPGPWEIGPDGFVRDADGKVVVDANYRGSISERARANQAVIAASPTLRSALKAALDHVEHLAALGENEPKWAESARQAIALTEVAS